MAVKATAVKATPSTVPAAAKATKVPAPVAKKAKEEKPAVEPIPGPLGQQPAKYAPTTWVNGMRATREAKGYGRVAMAEALGIKVSLYWQIETHYGQEELAPWLAKAEALPIAPKRGKKA